VNKGFVVTTEQNDNWKTPAWLYRALDTEFAFDCDAAADETNTKVAGVYISEINAYSMHPNPPQGTRFFCNPPYSNILPFVRRALDGDCLWVFILPVRTRTEWFEMLRGAGPRVEFRWFRRRVPFDPPPGVEASSPRMDVFVAVVRARPGRASAAPGTSVPG
jgi:phage N-6-adenine-methyltransferase